MSARPRHGTSVSIRPAAVGAASAMSLAGPWSPGSSPCSSGTGARSPNSAMTRRRVRAGRVDRRACRDRERSGRSARRARPCPVTRSPVADGGDRLDVVGEIRAAAIGGRGERERQPIGFDHLVVVPLRAAGQPVRLDARGTAAASRPSRPAAAAAGAAPARAPSLRCVPSHASSLNAARSASRLRVHGAIGADQEGQRPQEPGRDARERAPLADRLARAIEPRRLQRAQAAVRGLLMVERGRRCRSRRLRPAPCAGRGCGLVGDRQPVDAAADRRARRTAPPAKRVEVAWTHRGRTFIL